MAPHFIKCAIVLFILASMGAHAQIISTYAGTGIAGYSGDGGQATNAQMHSPFGLAVDDVGNLYIAEKINSIIRKISSSGVMTTYAGTGVAGFSGDGGAATIAKLNSPVGVALDVTGNLYIAESGNLRIRKVNTSGIISTFAGNGTIGYSGDGAAATLAQLNYPTGVAVDAVGNVYIGDQGNNCIRKVNTGGIIWDQ